MIPTDKQVIENESSKDKFTRYLKSIYDIVKMIFNTVSENNEILKNILKQGTGGSMTKAQFYDLISKRYKVRDLTPRQLYFLYKDSGDADFVCAISGLTKEEASKKIEGFKIKNQ